MHKIVLSTQNISERFDSANKLSTVVRLSVCALISLRHKEESSTKAKVAAIKSSQKTPTQAGTKGRRRLRS